jgi:hypothetical protein
MTTICRTVLAALLCLGLTLTVSAQAVPVVTAHGKVTKADKESLTFQPREAEGKFGKALTLKVTGTSRISTLSTRMQDKKLVLVQKDTDAKDITAGEFIHVIYATPAGQDPVLLSAVVQPAEK